MERMCYIYLWVGFIYVLVFFFLNVYYIFFLGVIGFRYDWRILYFFG